jgi:hypothetical protein
MAMKITKSELKQMIREALREELSNSKKLREAVLDDLEDALYTPGVWGISWVGEDCICYDNEKEARKAFAKLTVDDIPRDCEGIELFYVLDERGNTKTVDVISASMQDNNTVIDIENLDAPKATAEGRYICSVCKNIFQQNEVYNTVFGNNICDDCNDSYINSADGDVEAFFIVAKDGADWYEVADIRNMVKAWLLAKKKKALKFTDAEISAIEDAFISNVEYAGLDRGLNGLKSLRK